MKGRYLLFAIILVGNSIFAQDRPVHPSSIVSGKFIGISKPLHELPTLTADELIRISERARIKQFNERLNIRSYPFSFTALPKGPDPVWQQAMGTAAGSRAPIQNFGGQDSPYYPPDCNGAAGPNHYMQDINCVYTIYDKSGNLLAGPTNMNLLFGSVPGASYNNGDPIILYDEMAGRWLAAEFSIGGPNDYMMVAVSTTNDPTGTWYQYSFDVDDMPDYPKFGVWRDGYYMADNNSTSNDIYVFQRSQMLVGESALMVGFNNPYRPTSVDGFMMVPPVDNDGTIPAPAGAPGTFIAFNDDAVGGGSDELWIFELSVNWTTPSLSTFARVQQLAVAPFSSNFGTTWDNIFQPNTQKLDAIPQVIMNVPQYRNFGSYQTIVCCHTVNVDNNILTNHAGIRWYEMRRGTQTSGNWAIRQQGTYAPDANSRWMGSIMLNGSGRIGLGYSISSSTVYPGIRYCGQTSAAYNSASGILDIPEEIIQDGSYAQSSYNRWGDYSNLSVDPADDLTFWYTSEYIGAGGTRKTEIASFKIGNIPIVATSSATSVTTTSAILNGTINPNGQATTYYFDWGATTAYGNSTPVQSAGSGLTSLPVSATISGLTLGTLYHFRFVGSNVDGTVAGNDFSFTPGTPIITTNSVSSITLTSAVSGGNITTDGGFQVTSRGVCWGLSANPLATGNHTTDGLGTGTYTSSLSGLTSNTIYHVRAYAVSSNGTFYGNDIIFSTLCGVYTAPFSEGFSSRTLPTCWSQVDHSGSGQIWQFGVMLGGDPNPALNGNYAYLDSDFYGSGYYQNADLITPTMDLSSFSSITLQFNHYFKAYTGSSGTVSYSTDNGFTWTAITTFNTTSVINPVAFSQSIPAAAGQTLVKFKWNYSGSYAFYWAIDDVSVTGTPATSPVVTTTAVSSVTQTSASSGGNVTSQGSSGVVSRGVCWNTSSNPTTTNSHTNDGSGTGVYTSSITGLLPSTTYHVRAYALNGTGTAYGDDLSFTTLCGTIASFPWTENFDHSGTIPNCWTQEQVNNSGINWTFITGNGNSHPSTAHSGSFNACLKDNTSADNKTRLITPPINLNMILSPQLKFWHTQASWGGDQDQLAIYYRTSSTNPWILITTYTNSITAWTQETINLPASSANFYIAFEGNAKYGYGVCLDDVTVTGTIPTLSVTPSNQSVNAESGTASFSVTSNSTWSVSSNQLWCTVTSSGTGNGTLVATYSQNTTNTQRVAIIAVNVTGATPVSVSVTQAGIPDKTLNLTLFLEGLYDGNGIMGQAMDLNGYHWGPTTADKITVELHDAANYSSILYSNDNVFLSINGNASLSVPGIYNGSYYLTIKHWNSLETTSAAPVSFATASVSYAFDVPAKAYGGNLQLMEDGWWTIFTGDVNQDRIIDSDDLSMTGNYATLAIMGYLPEDINGDSLIDATDLAVIENNSTHAVTAKTP